MLNDFTYLYKSFTFTISETNYSYVTYCIPLNKMSSLNEIVMLSFTCVFG